MGYLLIFDVDGTLIDSEKTIIRCLRDSSSKSGYALTEIRRDIGVIKLTQILERNGVKENDIPEIMKGYNECFLSTFVLDTKPKENSREVLGKLQEKNEIGILTLKNREQTTRIIEHFYPDIKFKYIVCGDEPIVDKKNGLGTIVRKSGRNDEEIFYIGDRATDVNSALDSGIGAVWVSFGLGREEELDPGKHFLVARKFDDLIGFFNFQT